MEDENDSDFLLPMVNRIDDYNDLIPNGHRILNKKEREGTIPITDEVTRLTTLPSEIPQSLYKAIKCFIVTCAVRRLRGQTTVHNSMLVHVSRFVTWQGHIKTLVENSFDFYRRGI